MDHQSILQSLDKTWNQRKPTPRAAFVARYTGGVLHEKRKADEQSRLQFKGYQLPVVRTDVAEALRRLDPDVDAKRLAADLLRLCQRTQIHELRSAALMILERVDLKKELPWKSVQPFARLIDNWAHSDQLSQIFARHLEKENTIGKSQIIQNQLLQWNQHKNPWHRRLSLTSLYYYARFRKTMPNTQIVLQMLENCMQDPHYYVQKAVGWCLRELDRVEPKIQKKFVEKNLHKISGTAWFATSELYSLSEKKRLVQKRRKK